MPTAALHRPAKHPRIATERHQRESFRILRQSFWPRDLAVLLADKVNSHRTKLVLMYAEQLARSEARALQQPDPKRAACGNDA
jgi:hypothetical protein